MLGILLNALVPAKKVTEDLTTIYNFKQNIFGRGVYSGTYTITGDVNNQWLESQAGTLEFENLVVEAGAVLRPVHYDAGDWGLGAGRGPYSVLTVKCSDTLTVRGVITSAGTGGRNERYHDTSRHYYSTCPIGLNEPQAWGNSADSSNYYKLFTYGMTRTFFDNETFIYGAGGGGGHRYVRGKWGRHHNDHFNNYGFTCGGRTGGNNNDTYGAGGGFVALYFEHLIIDGVEYGKGICNVAKISANGGYTGREANREGGGSIIIAARTINISGQNASINSDAVTTGSRRLSFLNSYPQLGPHQQGYVLRSDGATIWGGTSGTYTYNTGLLDANGNPITAQTTDSSTWEGVGGAGLAFGFKLS